MKDLYLIGGAMGIGKTAVGQQLKRDLPNSVFLDGDWCWDADPFLVTEETKAMVLENICFLLNNFLRCTAYDHVIFCWVMHQQEIIDAILSRLNAEDCRVHCLSLVCRPDVLEERLRGDIAEGVRTPDILEKSLSYLPLYGALHTEKVDTSELSVQQAADLIAHSTPSHRARF